MKNVVHSVSYAMLGLAACGGTPNVDIDEIETGEADQALGEMYCAGHPDIQVDGEDCSWTPFFPTCRYASPSSYGSLGCPQQYTVQINNAYSQSASPVVYWADTPISQVNCVTSWLDLTAFVKTDTGGGAITEVLGTTKLQGHWTGSACQFNYAYGYSAIPDFNGTESTFAVVTTARARTCILDAGCTLKKVGSGFQ